MGFQLYAEERGSGEALILLHGNGESGEYFSEQISFFAEHYRVIALDTRGHGRSPRGDALFTIGQFAEDLRVFMDRFALTKANLLGFSDGGNIALTFALRYPERVFSLILSGANLFPGGVKASVQIPIVLGYRIASLFARKSSEAAKNAEMLRLMVKEPDIRPEELQKLVMPVLVVAGTRDMIKKRHTELIAKNLPNSELVFLRGDHFVAKKNPVDFNRAVLSFLKKTADRSRKS